MKPDFSNFKESLESIFGQSLTEDATIAAKDMHEHWEKYVEGFVKGDLRILVDPLMLSQKRPDYGRDGGTLTRDLLGYIENNELEGMTHICAHYIAGTIAISAKSSRDVHWPEYPSNCFSGKTDFIGGGKVPEEYYNRKPSGEKGCFIATVVYGSPEYEEVVLLRKYRDEVLAYSRLGKKFIAYYYKYSPILALRLSQHELMKKIIKKILTYILRYIGR